jgi:hypothetical protein
MALSAILHFLISFGLIGDGDSPVRFARQQDRLSIQINGKPFATYVWNDPTVKRPYFGKPRQV